MQKNIDSIANTNDDYVTTDEVTASSLYDVYKPLMDPKAILTFDGKSYEESIKLNEYPLIARTDGNTGEATPSQMKLLFGLFTINKEIPRNCLKATSNTSES